MFTNVPDSLSMLFSSIASKGSEYDYLSLGL